MTIHEKMQTLIAPVVAATVPSSRIKPPDEAQSMVRPYIVHFWSATEATETTDGTDNIRMHDYKVVVFVDEWGDGEALCDTLRDNLPGNYSGVVIRWSRTEYGGMDDATRVHEFMVTFEVAEKL